MKIETKFSNGDKVWTITFTQEEYKEQCTGCSGKGAILLDDGSNIDCPKCRCGYKSAGYNIKRKPKQWRVDETLTIGRVGVEVTNTPGIAGAEQISNYSASKGMEEKYMCIETGIGSGSVYGLDRIFATKKDAEKECVKRNTQAAKP